MADTIHANRLGAHRRLVERGLIPTVAADIGPISINLPTSLPISVPTSIPTIPSILPPKPHSTTEKTTTKQSTVESSTHVSSAAPSSTSSATSESKSSSLSTSSSAAHSSSTHSSSSLTSSAASSSSHSSSSIVSSSSSSSSGSSRSSTATTTSIPVVSTPVVSSTPPVIITSSYTPTYLPASSIAVTGAAASPSSTNSTTVSTGAVIGGVAAGIAGLAGLLFVALYFWRRSNNDDSEIDDFNARAFKHQSVMLPDDDGMLSRSHPVVRGASEDFGDPHQPPTMMERTMANVPASYGAASPMYAGVGAQAAYYNNSYSAQPSFMPGQYVSMNPGQAVPVVNPFVAPYGQVPGGPSVDGSPYDHAYRAASPPNAGSQYVTRQPSLGPAQSLSRSPSALQPSLYTQPSDLAAQLLSRKPSGGAAQHLSEQLFPGTEGTVGPDPHYVDLNRSSVTPYQAAQYSEISRRLNIQPPAPFSSPHAQTFAQQTVPMPSSPDVGEGAPAMAYAPPAYTHDKQLPVEPEYELEIGNEYQHESPFDDSQEVQEVHTHPGYENDVFVNGHEGPTSHRDSSASLPLPDFEGRTRVPSTPPILPEIRLQQRSFSPVSAEFPIAPSSVGPSPLGASFVLPSPLPEAHFTQTQTPIMSHPPSINAVNSTTARSPALEDRVDAFAVRRPETAYTLYDDDDAYLGI